jgi:hypothetical protein
MSNNNDNDDDNGRQLILHASANGQTKESRTVSLLSEDPYRPKKRKRLPEKVLDEDDFVDSLQHIIERDYFPDLPRLRTKLAWLKVCCVGFRNFRRPFYGVEMRCCRRKRTAILQQCVPFNDNTVASERCDARRRATRAQCTRRALSPRPAPLTTRHTIQQHRQQHHRQQQRRRRRRRRR